MQARRRAFRRRGSRQGSSRASWGSRFYVSLPLGGLLRQPYECSHALVRLVAAEGEETMLFGVRAKPSPIHLHHTGLSKALTGNGVKVEQPVARTVRSEGNFRGGIAIEKSLAHLRADLVHLRADGGAEPRHD